jgi:hypothetical protein
MSPKRKSHPTQKGCTGFDALIRLRRATLRLRRATLRSRLLCAKPDSVGQLRFYKFISHF